MLIMDKILLVDDDEATNFYNNYILKRNVVDCEIVMLENGLKALDYIKKYSMPDMIFLDINMPVMDGIQFLKEAHKWFNDKLNNVKIFVMVSVDLTEDRLEQLKGVSDVEMLKGKMLTQEFININIKKSA